MRIECKVSIVAKIAVVREGLKRILAEGGFEIIDSVSSQAELERRADDDHRCHIILCDINGSGEAVHVAKALRSRFEDSRIVFMADETGIESIAAAFGEGIDGYFIKSISCESLDSALRLVAAGEKVFPSQMVSALNATVWKLPPGKWDMGDLNLSARELQILRCLVTGHSNKIIARQLLITESTVKAHVKTVLRKLRVTNRTQAAIWAFTRGLETDPMTLDQSEATRPPVVRVQNPPQLRVAS
jgi:two-component system, NarL family, nitrate/nitrite response regulator NarL